MAAMLDTVLAAVLDFQDSIERSGSYMTMLNAAIDAGLTERIYQKTVNRIMADVEFFSSETGIQIVGPGMDIRGLSTEQKCDYLAIAEQMTGIVKAAPAFADLAADWPSAMATQDVADFLAQHDCPLLARIVQAAIIVPPGPIARAKPDPKAPQP